jgi:hypothetical protein
MITLFENFENYDLRPITPLVRCIRNLKNIFKEDKIYKVKYSSGDPQRAVEEFGMNEELPLECIKFVFIIGEDNDVHKFKIDVDADIDIFWNVEPEGDFLEYFDLMPESSDAKKYNL